MGILRILRVTGFIISLGAFLTLGHQYYSAMAASDGPSARFVSSSGQEIDRAPQGAPTFIESTKAFFAGLTGKEQKPKNGLRDLHTRTKLSQMTYDEQATKEMDFWMNFTSKLGFTGP